MTNIVTALLLVGLLLQIGVASAREGQVRGHTRVVRVVTERQLKSKMDRTAPPDSYDEETLIMDVMQQADSADNLGMIMPEEDSGDAIFVPGDSDGNTSPDEPGFGPTEVTLQATLLFGFFEEADLREPTEAEIDSLVIQTEAFYMESLMKNYSNLVGFDINVLKWTFVNSTETSYPVTVEFLATGMFAEGTEAPTTSELLGAMETLDYTSYIQFYVWQTEPVGMNLFHETQRVFFLASTDQPEEPVESPTKSPVSEPDTGVAGPGTTTVNVTIVYISSGSAVMASKALDGSTRRKLQVVETMPSEVEVDVLIASTLAYYLKVYTRAFPDTLLLYSPTNVMTESQAGGIFVLNFEANLDFLSVPPAEEVLDVTVGIDTEEYIVYYVRPSGPYFNQTEAVDIAADVTEEVVVVPPTSTPTVTPVESTSSPTEVPTGSPTTLVTSSPTVSTTMLKTSSPTMSATMLETSSPTTTATMPETSMPTTTATMMETSSPTLAATMMETSTPTISDTMLVTSTPTMVPSMLIETSSPTAAATMMETQISTTTPTMMTTTTAPSMLLTVPETASPTGGETTQLPETAVPTEGGTTEVPATAAPTGGEAVAETPAPTIADSPEETACPGRTARVIGTISIELDPTQDLVEPTEEQVVEIAQHILQAFGVILRDAYGSGIRGFSATIDETDTDLEGSAYPLGFDATILFAPCAPPPEEVNTVFGDADYSAILATFEPTGEDNVFQYVTGDASYTGETTIEP